MTGFIVMERDALDHPLLKDGERFRAFFWLVAKACWKPTPYDISGKVISLERGQLCASRSQLAEAWGWSPSAVERFLTRLETEQMIGRATGQGKTIITICNYAKYQDVETKTGQAAGQETGQRPDSDRTTKEQGNKGTRDIPSAKADGRDDAPPPLALDFAATIFRTGLTILMDAGHKEQPARSIIGRWKKNYHESVVIAVLARCQKHTPENPVEWITAGLKAEAERAAGRVSFHQGSAPERPSTKQIGFEVAERRRQRRLDQEQHQQRIAIGER
ncbi:hypothetical protein [Novosphingobium pentaromativorans]|uniref:Uncharacterized protein n=1 Tax=Novosphingobium pentaromativorans US6-1 TaxID=1088721 RepID=G6E8S8_9SPHN|nr:hypothetical protein [Novosphingobium pentaromativorans]EHJ62152.1 hypothetical protein NSU_0749 [Novosphingobium pentaromativorans US6-1]